MITREQALTADEFHVERPGDKRGCERWRRNGKTKTWKTRPDEFRVPVKFGLRSYAYITETMMNDGSLHTEQDCPYQVHPAG